VNSSLRILHLEDDLTDAELVQAMLEGDGIVCHVTRVENRADFCAALQKDFDLILADYTLPSFDGISALKIAAEKRPETPFIFVSGTLDEEVAIEALKIGATDYVFKTRISRIIPSVQRALREGQERSERKRAENALRRSEAYLAEAQRLSHTGSFGWNVATGEIYWSAETFRIFGFEPGIRPTVEFAMQRAHPEDKTIVRKMVDRASQEKKDFDFEHRLLLPDGSVKYLRVVGHPSQDESGNFEFVGAVTDITERKRAEEALRQSEGCLAEAQKLTHTSSFFWRVAGRETLHLSDEWYRIYGFDPKDGMPDWDKRLERVHPEDRSKWQGTIDRAVREESDYEMEFRILLPDGTAKSIVTVGHPVFNSTGELVQFVGSSTDITERKRAQDDLQNAFEEIRKLKDQLYKENIALREEIDSASMFEEIVGESRALQTVLARIAKVAPSDSTVLITGETGTGKELVARAIHKRSQRSSRAFVSVNCAAIPATLIAAELFGHEKGGFTGAVQRRLGRFEIADGGTIFLDEIGELPPETQIALLRVLQEREFERVGGSQSIRTDVRVIAATNRDLQAAIASGAFRSDLFYRLSVFPVEVPPLRERKEDIPVLVEYFIDRFSRNAGKKIRNIEKKTLELLQSYSWPGNIRELQNVIERSVIVCETETFSVDESWISVQSSVARQEIRYANGKSVADETQMIEDALANTQGRISGPRGAAAQLGMPPSTLESKIRTLRINKYRFKRA
jgi:PAS domain S-box-containing protein